MSRRPSGGLSAGTLCQMIRQGANKQVFGCRAAVGAPALGVRASAKAV
jgi:hypothetical protein